MHRDAGYDGLGANLGSGAMPKAQFDKDRSTEPLRAVLAAVLPDLHSSCRDPWVVIGSAAACLVGAGVSVADLDWPEARRVWATCGRSPERLAT